MQKVDEFRDSQNAYDSGKFHYAERLASLMYVFLQDGSSNKSLLKLLGLRERMIFKSTKKNSTDPYGLFLKNYYIDSKIGARYAPILDSQGQGKSLKFGNWWTEEIFSSENGAKITRQYLVDRTRNELDSHIDEYSRDRDINKFFTEGDSRLKTAKNREWIPARHRRTSSLHCGQGS